LITVVLELTHHYLAINEVLGTTQTDKTNLVHDSRVDLDEVQVQSNTFILSSHYPLSSTGSSQNSIQP